MGILNVTPDSFSDGGLWVNPESALSHAAEMARDGADLVDIGGESTRPGSAEVPVQQELDRVIPLIESITAETGLPVSVDTSKPEVMTAAVSAGASMLNDVYALRRENALETAASLGVPVCIMHMKGTPRSMQHDPVYNDVCDEVLRFLLERAQDCVDSGLPAGHVIIDPGFGFGKTLQHNLQLFSGLRAFVSAPYPVLVGVSRKSMLGQLTGRGVDDRMAASVTAAVLAAQVGAKILRVHDVAETVDALKVLDAVQVD